LVAPIHLEELVMADVVQLRARRLWTVSALVAAGFVATACDDSLGSGNSDETSITFRTATSSGVASLAGAALASIPVTGGGHTVDVQQVDLLFDRIKLERVHGRDARDSGNSGNGNGDSDSDSEDSDSRNDSPFRAGATTVSLPLSGGTVSPISQLIPEGTYDELQMDARYARVRGTYDGEAFDVTIPVNARIETDLDPPFSPTDALGTPNITVNVDVSSWFKNSDGSVVDPRRLATDASLRAAFRNRMRASFRALEDSNKDGRDSDSR
jgi:hypothetical protein